MTPATYVVNVPDVGTFEVRKRTLRVQMAIHAELNRLTEGAPLATLSDWFIDLCGLVAELKGLIIKAPDGWSMEDIDPLDDGYDRLRAVYRAIRTQEDSFRTQAKGDQATGAGGSEQPAMVVPGSVSAATE
jgi:hypothetical protein